MSGRLERTRREDESVRSVRLAPPWRGFRRARHALWGSLLALVAAGALLHDVTAQSLPLRMLWFTGVVVLVGLPLRYLCGFLCPRCGSVYLATGGLRDFLGLGRILWAKRCGSCELEAGNGEAAAAAEVPESRPVPGA